MQVCVHPHFSGICLHDADSSSENHVYLFLIIFLIFKTEVQGTEFDLIRLHTPFSFTRAPEMTALV